MVWRAFKREMKLHPFDCEFVTLVMYRKNNILRKLGSASLVEDLEMLEAEFALFRETLISTWCMLMLCLLVAEQLPKRHAGRR